MSTITRERLEQLANFRGAPVTRQEEQELARIALASFESEPAYFINRVKHSDAYGEDVELRTYCYELDALKSKDDFGGEVVPVYTAPPAPGNAEPVAWLWSNRKHPSEVTLVRSEDDEKAEAAQWSGWSYKALYAEPSAPLAYEDLLHMAASAIDDLLSNKDWSGAGVWADIPAKLRRAVTLQGAEPVTTANKLRDAVDTIRNSGIAIDAEKILAERDALNAPDCWCRTCRPVKLDDMRFVVCPECGNKRCPHANDHRNACTGSNEPGQEGSAYPAAPQQEVKNG